MLLTLDKKNSTIDICELKDQTPWLPDCDDVKKVTMEMIDLEIILSARMPVENFMDMLNFVRASFGIKGSDWKKGLVSAVAVLPNERT